MSAAEDWKKTRELRRDMSGPSIVKPKQQRVDFHCKNCNLTCMLEAPVGWRGTHHCSHCGGLMVRI